jgi:hypothetical protein
MQFFYRRIKQRLQVIREGRGTRRDAELQRAYHSDHSASSLQAGSDKQFFCHGWLCPPSWGLAGARRSTTEEGRGGRRRRTRQDLISPWPSLEEREKKNELIAFLLVARSELTLKRTPEILIAHEV